MRLWQENEEAILKQLVDKGCTMEDALRVFPKRSRDSIDGKLRRMGIELQSGVPEIDMDVFRKLMERR